MIDTIMSGNHATNNEIPVTIKNTFIPFVKLYVQTFPCLIFTICNFASNKHKLKNKTPNKAIYIKCKIL